MSDEAKIGGDLSAKLAALTPGQRECLRLVGKLHTSKMIAKRLGISSHAVDARIRAALRTLEVATRADAAQLFSDDEAATYQSLIYQSPGLSTGEHRLIDQPSLDGFAPFGDEVRNELAEGQAALFPSHLVAGPVHRWSFWDLFSAEQHLPVTSRVAVIIAVALAGVVLAALLVNLAEGVSRLV